MIAIIAGTYKEAQTWARGQLLDDEEWFYLSDFDDLIDKRNFHVIVVGTAGDNIPSHYFERLFHLAKRKGRMK